MSPTYSAKHLFPLVDDSQYSVCSGLMEGGVRNFLGKDFFCVSFSRLRHSAGMKPGEIDLLIRRIRGGETECFAEVIRRYEQPVWRVVAAMLQDFDRSREMLQQVFVNAYVHLDRYELGRDFEVWIKEIARNCVRQELRQLARRSTRLEAYRLQLEREWSAAGTAEREEARYLEALTTCREQLPERSAQAISMRYEQGRSFDEIAACLSTTRDAAEKLLSRVRSLLRECIESRLSQA